MNEIKVKSESTVKESKKLPSDVEKLKKSLDAQYKTLCKDKMQDPISFKDFVQAKLDVLSRIEAKSINRVMAETPKDYNQAQKDLLMAGAKKYESHLEGLKQLVKEC